MSSFSCPHYDQCHEACVRIGDVCVPGRPGCVLYRNSVFAVPWEVRLEARRREGYTGGVDGKTVIDPTPSSRPDKKA